MALRALSEEVALAEVQGQERLPSERVCHVVASQLHDIRVGEENGRVGALLLPPEGHVPKARRCLGKPPLAELPRKRTHQSGGPLVSTGHGHKRGTTMKGGWFGIWFPSNDPTETLFPILYANSTELCP